MPEPEAIICEDLQTEIRRYTRELGYRLDMIMSADDPREAIVSKQGDSIRLVSIGKVNLERTRHGDWTTGRAGMMYRDLVPDRLGGKLIASHIRIVEGGEVPDRVHYHKIDFQIIYCLKGAIRVVYEDQGPPFWLKPGDCVLQPPEIRHRVVEAEAGSEVIEITAPAEHETWFDHDLDLPTRSVQHHRIFGTQRFVRHLDAESRWVDDDGETMIASTEIGTAGNGAPDVYTLQAKDGRGNLMECTERDGILLRILVEGRGIALTYD